MGRASRKREELRSGHRAPTQRERYRRALKADRRGQRVGSSLADYERVSGLGSDRLAETLIARHSRRMDGISRLPYPYRDRVMSRLAPVASLDLVLLLHGADRTRPPCAYGGGWIDHLMWGADSAVAASRLLLCGQFVGAAAVARNQLERWTMHRAFNAGVAQSEGESTLDYVARAWSVPDRFFAVRSHEPTVSESFDADDESVSAEEPVVQHAHVTLSDGWEVCPAVLYGGLSEIMHARELRFATLWDVEGFRVSDQGWPEDVSVALGVITDTISLCLRQLRIAAATVAQERGDLRSVELLRSTLDGFSLPDPAQESAPSLKRRDVQGHRAPFALAPPSSPPLLTLAPLTPEEGLSSRAQGILEALHETFEKTARGTRPAGRLYKDDEFVTLAFGWHRARSAHTALRGLEEERELLGDEFNIDGIAARSTALILVSEASGLLGLWHPDAHVAAAAACVGSGLRSANWLWLEDDDRAMSVLRCVLEQTARLRVWRCKPTKALLLESRWQTTPRDWMEEAGWRRLTALNRALGEFAHTKPTSRWSGARELLAALQIEVDRDRALLTARGASIEFVTSLSAQETTALVADLSPTVAERMQELFESVGIAMSPDSVEAKLNHIWKLRSAGLGTPDFQRD